MTHEIYKELLAANALTALDAEDARALNTHLESCPECRSEMNEWQETAAFLALDTGAIEPTPDLRERILASVHKTSRQGRSSQGIDVAEPIAGSSNAKVMAFERQRKNAPSSWGSFGAWGSIAAALALVALLISLVLLWQENRTTRKELAGLSAQMQETKEQLAHEREVVELLTSPGARMAELSGTKVAPGAHAMLAYDRKGHAMLMAKGLPPAPKGMAYQLWFIMGNKPMPGKVFTTDASGNASLKDQLPMPAPGSAVFAITLEPESGMQSPTGAIYLSSAS